jgi:CubicO group peptidase (beta-lactamase class C family)
MDYSLLEGFIFEKISRTHLPGLSLAIVENGELAYNRGLLLSRLRVRFKGYS